MTISNTTALYWAGTVALVVAAVAVVVRRAPRPAAAPLLIPDRWAELRTLHPEAQARFLNLYRRIEQETGAEVRPTSGYRGYLAGSEQPAYHYFGLADDLNIILPDGTWLKMGSTRAAWEGSGVPDIIRRTPGFRWGGDFQAVEKGALFGDPVHVDLGRAHPIAQLRALAMRLAFPGSLKGFDGRKVSLSLVG